MKQLQKNNGKRIGTVLLAMLLVLGCLLPVNMQAYAGNMIIALSANSVKIGQILTVTVTLPAGVTGTVNLTYTPSVFTFQSASANSSVNAGTVSMTLGSYGSGSRRASANVRFQANTAGTGSFAASAPNAGNQDGDRVSIGGASVAVTVENATNETTKSADNSLSALSISEGTLSPAFQADVTAYTATVDNAVTSLAVSATPTDANASVVSVNGADGLKEGANTVLVVVQAENGVQKTYTITVTRAAEEKQEEAAQKETEKETQNTTEAAKDTKDTKTKKKKKVSFTINGTKLYPTDSIPDRYVLDGFVKDTVMLSKKDYPCIRKDNVDTPLRLLYLVDKEGKNGALYMLDLDDPKEIYPFVCMNYTQYIHTMGEQTQTAEPSTEDGTALFQDSDSQTRLLFSAFVVVVVILLIIIVILLVKRGRTRDEDDELYGDDLYDDEDDDDLDEGIGYEIPDFRKRKKSRLARRHKHGEESGQKEDFLDKLLTGDIHVQGSVLPDETDDLEEEEDVPEPEPKTVRTAPVQRHHLEPPPVSGEAFKSSLEQEERTTHKPLASEAKPSFLGRRKKKSKKDADDDIEFIDL